MLKAWCGFSSSVWFSCQLVVELDGLSLLLLLVRAVLFSPLTLRRTRGVYLLLLVAKNSLFVFHILTTQHRQNEITTEDSQMFLVLGDLTFSVSLSQAEFRARVNLSCKMLMETPLHGIPWNSVSKFQLMDQHQLRACNMDTISVSAGSCGILTPSTVQQNHSRMHRAWSNIFINNVRLGCELRDTYKAVALVLAHGH
ncbi:hypothetical protein K432DRAFT_77184 [Lepidopterella palustris CBS 459.81]|uniref:Uncharacterized protein n=1 Tax=Lepidopterella palustris CBS 459.81 TaxID=1314670 RepID=A0A8E2JK54_9PEZI|nr:hypothetical protein K432DRAFT_77184 [Lepidopterella palustris CBS 459.81]